MVTRSKRASKAKQAAITSDRESGEGSREHDMDILRQAKDEGIESSARNANSLSSEEGKDMEKKNARNDDIHADAAVKGDEGTAEANDAPKFANLEGIGEHADSSDEDGPLETLALSRLPGQIVSEIRNDEPGLLKKLSDIAMFATGEEKQGLPFWESLTVKMPLESKLHDSLAMDDLKREQKFAEMATAAVHLGLETLRVQKVKFRRPSDYFAQMVKTDAQMGKVKAKILHEKEEIESAEKRRNNRDIAKNRKKVRSTQLQKEQEKKRKAKDEIEAFSRLRKQRVKDRAAGAGNIDNDEDDDFPIELLEVEQLDADNKFRPESDIKSGKRTAWSQKNDKLSKSSAPGSEKIRAKGDGKRHVKGRNSDSPKGRMASQDRGRGKQGASGGISKAKGTKKRLGRSRRKASGK